MAVARALSARLLRRAVFKRRIRVVALFASGSSRRRRARVADDAARESRARRRDRARRDRARRRRAMPGPSAHGQRNKRHNSGKHQSKHAWRRHKTSSDASTLEMFGARARASMKLGHGVGNKRERALRGKQIRDANREALVMERRRARATPRVVGVLAFNEEEQGLDDLRACLETLVRTMGGR